MRVPKFLLPAPKNWILGPKTAKFGPKLASLAKYRHLIQCLTKKQFEHVTQAVFSIWWVPKRKVSPLRIWIFAQKRPNLAPNWHFGHFGSGLAGSFGALLVVEARGWYLARHLFTLQLREIIQVTAFLALQHLQGFICFVNPLKYMKPLKKLFVLTNKRSLTHRREQHKPQKRLIWSGTLVTS